MIKQKIVKPGDVASNDMITDFPTKDTTLQEKLKRIEHPYVCSNRSQVVPDPKKTYGYFKTEFVVQSEYFLKINCNRRFSNDLLEKNEDSFSKFHQ